MKLTTLWAMALLILGLIFGGAPAYAQATRTWVSGVGDDANPCSRTAPCKTFAGAISKTATAGEINVLDPGGFGALTITKSITIDGGGNLAGVLVSGTNGFTVNAPGSVVVLRNLDIDGIGTGLVGVQFLAGAALQIENTKIYGFTTAGINFAPSSGTSSLTLINTVVTDNPPAGILVVPTGGAIANANLNGVTATRNKFGLKVTDGAFVSVTNSVFSSNVNNGIIAVSTAAACEINAEKSLVTNNGQFGVVATGALATVRIAEVGIFDNGTGIAGQSGGQVISFGNNQNAGNTTNGAPTSTIANQ